MFLKKNKLLSKVFLWSDFYILSQDSELTAKIQVGSSLVNACQLTNNSEKIELDN